MADFDAVVVGAGPNGLAAAVELMRSGRRVLVVEASDTIGGGTKTEELTLPGFRHDVCSAMYPLGVGSPFFSDLRVGDWVQPDIPAAHPLGEGRVVTIARDLEATVDGLGADGGKYRALIEPLVRNAHDLVDSVLAPLTLPRHPMTLGRFGVPGMAPATLLASQFSTMEARAVFAGMASHAIAPLSRPFTGAVGEVFLTTAHAFGWPLVRGGSHGIARELADIVVEGGGAIETGHLVSSIDELPRVPIVLLDVMPPAALRIADGRLPSSSVRRLRRWAGGPGVFKVDWALDGPVPWMDPSSGRAGTVHVGGTLEEIAASEAAVAAGDHPDEPFVIVTQQSLFDGSRAPAGCHTLWGYCHVPAGSERDMTEAIERQIERFAPGFRDRILGRHTMTTMAFQDHNPNNVLGDIAGGAFSARRNLRFGSVRHYRIGDGIFLCGSSTPPGAGVHGMCGYHAARAAIRDTG